MLGGSLRSKGTGFSSIIYLVLLSWEPFWKPASAPSSVAVAQNFPFCWLFPKSHEKACSVKLVKTIEEGRVGRRDPYLSPTFRERHPPSPPRESVEPRLKTTDPQDLETKEGGLDTCEHFEVCIVETAKYCSQCPGSLSGQSGGQTKGWVPQRS